MAHRVNPNLARLNPRGFSFAEVMFAVIILGVGFIMIAGIFPVAIQQNQTTNQESGAAAAAREAANTATGIAASGNPVGTTPSLVYAYDATAPQGTAQAWKILPPTVKNYVQGTSPSAVAPPAIVVPMAGSAWNAIKDSLISSSDPRYAYVPFYRRDNNSSVAQLIVVAVAVQNRPIYDITKDVANNTTFPVTITTTYFGNPSAAAAPAAGLNTTIYPDTVTITTPGSAVLQEGATVSIVGTQLYSEASAGNPGGRSYLLGRYIGGNEFEASPGVALEFAPGTTPPLWGSYGPQWSTRDATVSGDSYWQFGAPATLQPTVAYASVYTAPGSLGGRITLSNGINYPAGNSASNVAPPCAAPGTFVIVADDYPYNSASGHASDVSYSLPVNNTSANLAPVNPPWAVGALNGRVFRLGQPVPVNTTDSTKPYVYPGTFELDPAYGMRPPTLSSLSTSATPVSPDVIPNPNGYVAPATAGPWARVYLVGEGRSDPTSTGITSSYYSGAAQDVSVYTTFIPVQ